MYEPANTHHDLYHTLLRTLNTSYTTIDYSVLALPDFIYVLAVEASCRAHANPFR